MGKLAETSKTVVKNAQNYHRNIAATFLPPNIVET
jgi:hypothetical protein